MPEPFTNNNFWWNGGTSTATGQTVGGFWNEISGKAQSEEAARVFNSAEAEKNRQWETYMSNTALQRQVADAKAAGINPASLQGNGASTPSASPASASPSGMGNGGFLGLIAQIGTAAIGKALYAKYMNTALKAKQEFQLPKLLSAIEKDQATAEKMKAQANHLKDLSMVLSGQAKKKRLHFGKDGKFQFGSEESYDWSDMYTKGTKV